MSANLSSLVPELAGAARSLVAAAGAARLMPRITSTLRSRAEQTRLYRRSLQGLQPFYVAPPGSSAHEYGWAFDMVVTPWDAIADVGYTWQQWGGAWSATDPVHFELPGAAAEATRLGRTQGTTGALSTVRTWLDWWNDLPWYIQVLLPFKSMAAKKELSQEEMAAIVASARG